MANVNPQGVDLTTGLNRLVKSGDTLTDADGSPITGLAGATGITGLTGVQGLGSTGIAGNTGIQGLTGNTGIASTAPFTESTTTGATATLTRTIPANTLDADNQQLDCIITGTTGPTSTSLEVRFGGVLLITLATSNSRDYVLRVNIRRTGSSAQEVAADAILDSNQAAVGFATGASDLTANQDFTITEAGSSPGTVDVITVRKWPA